MRRLYLPITIAIVLPACARPMSDARTGNESRQLDQISAVALEQEVTRLATLSATQGALWPGFNPLSIPLAVYDGENTLLFRHPSPPQGFQPFSGTVPLAQVFKGRHEALTANSNAEIGGVGTATVLLDRRQPGRPLRDLAAVAIHEAFHVYQRAKHPGWFGNEADLFTYPTESINNLALRRLETEALRRALATEDMTTAALWTRHALALRRERFAELDSAYVAYKRGTEMNEGLAAYVEMRAAGRLSVNLPPEEFGPSEGRVRAYASGPALALLLDRFHPNWRAAFESDDKQTLDPALAAAVGEGDTNTTGVDARAVAMEKARADIATLAEKRAQRLVAFEGKPGWSIVVEAGGNEPLWLQGFDPLNVDRVAAQRILHSRMLQLGNGAGQREVLNAEALTDGVGPHPLFQGVRRVELTGLEEPKVSETGELSRVHAPGLNVEFKGASVSRSGEVITVRVRS